MRLALALLLVGGCMRTYSDPPPDPGYPGGGWGSGYGGSGGTSGYGCHADTDCSASGEVCARSGECLPAAEVKIVHVNWTLLGQPAGTDTCATSPHLELTFLDSSDGAQFGFAPLPCVEGKFTVDKLPTWYTTVDLAKEGDYSAGVRAQFDANGNATLDLPY